MYSPLSVPFLIAEMKPVFEIDSHHLWTVGGRAPSLWCWLGYRAELGSAASAKGVCGRGSGAGLARIWRGSDVSGRAWTGLQLPPRPQSPGGSGGGEVRRQRALAGRARVHPSACVCLCVCVCARARECVCVRGHCGV